MSLIISPKTFCGLFLLCTICLFFPADTAYSDELKEFKPDEEKVKKFFASSFSEVKKELEAMPPQESINYSLILSYGQFIMSKNVKLAKMYCNYALETANKHNLKKGKMLCLFAWLFDAEQDLPKAIEYADRAVICLKQEQDVKSLIDGLSFLGNAAYRYGDFNKSIKAYEELLELFKKSGDEILEAKTIFDLGESYYRTGNQSKAKEIMPRAIAIFTKIENEKGLADCFKLLGNVCQAEKDYTKAKEHYAAALKHYENTNDSHGQGNCNFNLGLTSKELKEYPAAIESFNKAIFYYTNSGSTEGVGIAQMEMGRVYYLQENYSQAEAALKLAESLLSKSNAKFRLAQTEDFLGDLKLSQKDKNQAIAYYTRSFQDYGSLRLTADEQRIIKKLKDIGTKTPTH